MGTWCGTTKCVAGWACVLLDSKNLYDDKKYYNISIKGAEILGMQEQDKDLFMTNGNEGVIEILKILVSQKDLPETQQQTIFEIAENLGVELGLHF